MNVNQVNFAGHLGRDPEIRYTPKGTAVCEFSICSTRHFAGGDSGQAKEETCWLECVAWEKTATVIAEHCRKGSNLYVSGSLKQEDWIDKNTGGKRTKLKLVVQNFQFVGPKKDDGDAERPPQRPRQSAPAATQPPQQAPPPTEWPEDDAIPF